MSLGQNVLHWGRVQSFFRSFGLRNLKWQRFTLDIVNIGGVLNSRFWSETFNVVNSPQPDLCDRIFFASSNPVPVPALTAGGVGFGNSPVGTYSSGQYLLFNTRAQLLSSAQLVGWAQMVYQSSGATRIVPSIYYDKYDVFGSGSIYRPHLLMCNDFTNTFPSFTTGNISSGNTYRFDIGMFIN